ncbi:MAG TPA: glutaredoxin family protein [Candidatus Paceibacterota bacterium]
MSDNNVLSTGGGKKVTIYSTPTCHFCVMTKEYFKANNIPFEEFNVAGDSEKRKEMVDKSGQLGVPVITIDNDVVVGFNRPKLAKLLEIGDSVQKLG